MIRETVYEYWENPLPSLQERSFDFNLLCLDLINDIVGIRRAGKTYLMFQIIKYLTEKEKLNKKSTIYVNFENRKLYPLKSKYVNDLVELIYEERLLDKFEKIYLFLDEIQNLQNWEKYIRNIYDEFKGRIKIFLSGSNMKLLGREYVHLLSGRHITLVLYPLSFEEFLKFKGILPKRKNIILEKERAIIKKALNEYIQYGGFPEVVLSGLKEKILQQYFSDIISRDVVFKERIRKDIALLEELSIYLISNIANLTSFRRLTNLFNSRGMKITLPTLIHYHNLFEDAFLFFSTRIFSYKIKDQLQHPLKLYCVDTGLVNACGFKFSEDLGRLYENMVAVELKRRGKEIYYWKDKQQREVDFVVKERLKITQLIQVCLNLEDERMTKRKIQALLEASKELNCNNLLIITQNEEGKEEIKGMQMIYKPLWKWLLTDTE